MNGGDDLDDGLAYDVELSNDEGVDVESDSQFQNGADLSGDEHEDEENPKKRKKTDKLKEKKKLRMDMDMEHKKNLSKETSAEAIADFVNDNIRKKNPDLSALELAAKYLKKTDFRSSAEFEEPRTLDNFSKFIEARFKNMLPSSTPGKKNTNKGKKKKEKKKHEEAKEPTGNEERKFIAILSMSAIRACDVHRALRDIPGSSLKLINKNKLHVDLKLVKSTWSRVLCCTPGRLLKVLGDEEQPLKKDEIKIVLIDNTYLDQKLQNVWDIKETTETLKELTEAGSKIYLY
ncbi:CIC11C00000003938 [Sungouiella intermedia]|uniref:CIC11C00000003938 n=1 Tax=Sungouiella intermedia TaxID=45354 RepID=A0A1L0B9T9_9ASCO|nr:CIC11C00000003938 [[Candida] intermedia]